MWRKSDGAEDAVRNRRGHGAGGGGPLVLSGADDPPDRGCRPLGRAGLAVAGHGCRCCWSFMAWRTGGSPWPVIRKVRAGGGSGRASGWLSAMGGAILAFQTTTVANAAFLLAAAPFLAAVLGPRSCWEKRSPLAPGAAIALGAGRHLRDGARRAGGRGAAGQHRRADLGTWPCCRSAWRCAGVGPRTACLPAILGAALPPWSRGAGRR
jgi:hypothetical protein